MLLNNILQNKLFIVHVAHNTFTNLRYFTILPKNIIAVSNAVKHNLIDYFKINDKRIRVIYNGIEDARVNGNEIYNGLNDTSKIKILLAGRITKVKQQVELVINTKDALNSNIEIYFAGEGDTQKLLKEAIGQSNQYKLLGYTDIKKEMKNYDYVCMFSQKEGLGNSLIEGCMFGKPLLTNDIEAVLEINEHNYNGFVAKDWKELVMHINKLPNRSSDEYNRLSSNARKKYESFFTIDKMLSEYRDYIDACKVSMNMVRNNG
jgi:glycosyltransferase involved in cell wall biosynthesis